MAADILAFRTELTTLINKHSIENLCDTPDYVLSNYMCDALLAFAQANVADKKHHLSAEMVAREQEIATRRKIDEVNKETKEEK